MNNLKVRARRSNSHLGMYRIELWDTKKWEDAGEFYTNDATIFDDVNDVANGNPEEMMNYESVDEFYEDMRSRVANV